MRIVVTRVEAIFGEIKGVGRVLGAPECVRCVAPPRTALVLVPHPIMVRTAQLLVLLAASVAASRRLAISSVSSLRGGGAGDDPLSEAKAKWSGWLGEARAKAASLQGSKAATDPALSQALSLIKKRTLGNIEKAVGLLRGAHTRDPTNDDVKLELADALNAVMRIKTHANALVIEGTLDTPANKKVWKALGDEALPLARDVYKSRPGGPNPRKPYPSPKPNPNPNPKPEPEPSPEA